ncbi:MAG: hypothetical protein KAQ92_05785 [Candidatus Aenigmarchaeota archaeon]|nr:hypothetical protein [Candidatus Aenigmarchaeota archaeon]
MITLDTNLTNSSSSFHYLLLKLRRKYGYSNTNINKYAEAQSAKGASQTNGSEKAGKAENANEVNNVQLREDFDFEQLIKDLKLNLPENRFAILMMIPSSELFEMLKLLGKDNLLNGLKFFTKEKLMTFVAHLPKKDLLKMLFSLFTDRKQLIDYLPIKELHKFLTSDKIEKGHFMKIFEMLPKQTLARINGHLTGKSCDNMSKRDLLDQINSFKKYQLVNSLKNLDEKTMRDFVLTLVESFPKLYNEFSHVALFNISEKFARTDLIDSMKVIDSEQIINMLSELPDKLLALTVSQIDPEIFSAILLNNYKDLLADFVFG